MKSKVKVFTETQIIYSWIFGTMVLSTLMILINSIKLKKDIAGSIFFTIAAFTTLIYNVAQSNNIIDLFIFNQLSSILTTLLIIILMKKSSYKDSINKYDKYDGLTIIIVNSTFLISIYTIIFNIYKYNG